MNRTGAVCHRQDNNYTQSTWAQILPAGVRAGEGEAQRAAASAVANKRCCPIGLLIDAPFEAQLR